MGVVFFWLAWLGCGGSGEGESVASLGCPWGPCAGFSPSHAVSFDQSSSMPTSGRTTIILADGSLDCDSLRSAVGQPGRLSPYILGRDGVVLDLTWQLAEDSASSGAEPVLGTYGAGSAQVWSIDGTVRESRSATALWFDEAARWNADSDGLLVEITSIDTETLSGSIRHPWVQADFEAKRCGILDAPGGGHDSG